MKDFYSGAKYKLAYKIEVLYMVSSQKQDNFQDRLANSLINAANHIHKEYKAYLFNYKSHKGLSWQFISLKSVLLQIALRVLI